MPLLTHTETKHSLLGGCHLPWYKDILCELMDGYLPAATEAFCGRSEKIILFLAATTLLIPKPADKPSFCNIKHTKEGKERARKAA